MTLVTIGIPVRNEIENLPLLMLRVEKVISKLASQGIHTEIIVNNNLSTDGSSSVLDSWSASSNNISVYHSKFYMTFQQSVLYLMQKSNGDCFIILQSDLQDPPELIPEFVEQWKAGNMIVAGVITKRSEGFFEVLNRKLFYQLLKSFSDEKIIEGLQDFYLIDKSVMQELIKLPTDGLYLRGHLTTRFDSFCSINYSRDKRILGKTKFNFFEKYDLALNGFLLFGTRAIRYLSIASFILFAFALFTFFGFLFGYLFGFRPPIQGWLSLGLLLILILGILGMIAGIMFEYLRRIYRLLILK